jgi:type II secretory pathway predicted ATPase ExeA
MHSGRSLNLQIATSPAKTLIIAAPEIEQRLRSPELLAFWPRIQIRTDLALRTPDWTGINSKAEAAGKKGRLNRNRPYGVAWRRSAAPLTGAPQEIQERNTVTLVLSPIMALVRPPINAEKS